jgi:hypothetical protein
MFDPQEARLYLGCCRPPNRREPNMKAARRTIAFFQAAAIILDNDPTSNARRACMCKHILCRNPAPIRLDFAIL